MKVPDPMLYLKNNEEFKLRKTRRQYKLDLDW